MKKIYKKPNVSVSFVVGESQLLAGSGVDFGPGSEGGAFSKPHEFTDDSFADMPWPKSKSPWEDR